jgi:glutamine amidotransferase
MNPLIAVVDYEMGNLHSVAKAVEKAGGRVQVTSSPGAIRRAQAVLLPGVGAFGEAMKRLASKKLIAPVHEALQKNKPFMGICLGLQLLFERSEESPNTRGLGYFKGQVIRFRMPKNSNLKVPHMGWNTTEQGPAFKTPILHGMTPRSYFYFVHSYFPSPEETSIVATKTHYGRSFCSSVAMGRLFASQFHPEKSGDEGQKLLRNFVHEVATC